MKTFTITFLTNQFGSQKLRREETINELQLNELHKNGRIKIGGVFGIIIILENILSTIEIK